MQGLPRDDECASQIGFQDVLGRLGRRYWLGCTTPKLLPHPERQPIERVRSVARSAQTGSLVLERAGRSNPRSSGDD